MPAKKATKSSGKKKATATKSRKKESSLSSSRHNIMSGILDNLPKRGTKTKSGSKQESQLSSLSSRGSKGAKSSSSGASASARTVSLASFLKARPKIDDAYTVVFLVNPLESTTETLRVAWPETCLACGHWFDFPAAAVESVIPLGVEQCCATPFPKVALRIKSKEEALIQMLRSHLAGNIGSEAGEQANVQTRGLAAVTFEEELCGTDETATGTRGLEDTPPASLELSGAQWVSKFPGSRSIFDLKPPFLDKISKFHQALADAGANIKINATFRPPERAFLMHFAFRIARKGFDPRSVPPMAGVNIQWFHGNTAASKNAAEQMVRAYGIAFAPSLRSRHTEGLAIDMTVTWAGTLRIKDASGALKSIGSPANGNTNSALHNVGRTYGVVKLVSDPPHWSVDGH
ncbi:MAG TPA: hypothetical protein VNA19_17045 [Pyrinomonadaceae bacterium]|jgi:hypothetical protein|nr:hypothetical protein [Pyrinomonadaceae bacterium]